MDTTFEFLGLTGHAYGLCAAIAALLLMAGVRIAGGKKLPQGTAGVFAVLGIVLSAGLIVLSDFMDTTITSEDYLTHVYPQYPLLAVIPDSESAQNSYRKGYHRRYYRGYYQTEPETRGGESK